MTALPLDTAFGGGAPVRLLPPYDKRVINVIASIKTSIDASDVAHSRTLSLFPREDGSLAIYFTFSDGGSVGLIVPGAFWEMLAHGAPH